METVRFAKSANATLLACGVDAKSSLDLLRLAVASPEVLKAFVGVHPSEAEKGRDLGWLDSALSKASGAGEIGLDPTYSTIGEGSAQMEVFRAQLEAAEKLQKPVQVHSRSATTKCLEVLGSHRPGSVLLHWLDDEAGSSEAADRGYFISFGPALLFSKKLQRIAAKTDPSLVLLETDSPVPYAPLGGARGPVLVPTVAFKLAELRGESFPDTLERCNENSTRFLGEKG